MACCGRHACFLHGPTPARKSEQGGRMSGQVRQGDTEAIRLSRAGCVKLHSFLLLLLKTSTRQAVRRPVRKLQANTTTPITRSMWMYDPPTWLVKPSNHRKTSAPAIVHPMMSSPSICPSLPAEGPQGGSPHPALAGKRGSHDPPVREAPSV